MTAAASTTARASVDASDRHSDRHSDKISARVTVLLHDALLGRALGTALRENGFEVLTPAPPTDTAGLATLVATSRPDLVVVDVGNPSQWPVTATLEAVHRSTRGTPEPRVIGVTPPADDDMRITALLAGADDAVSIPITPVELSARCRAVLRRSYTDRQAIDPRTSRLLTFGPLTVDVGRKEIRILGRDVPATRIEYALFEQLCRHPDEVRPRTTLLADVWGPHWIGDTHIVDVHLSNLRRKFQQVAPDMNVIHTVRGIGFRLSDELTAMETHTTDRRSA